MMLTNTVLALRDSLGPIVFVPILFLLSPHPEQYPGTMPSGEEFLFSIMLKVKPFRHVFYIISFLLFH